MFSNILQVIKQRYSKIAITLGLFLIISGYCVNNLIWTARSPIYFYRDSIANIQWAAYYGKFLRGENLVYQPGLFDLLKNKNIEINSMIYYQEYSEIFKGPLISKGKIDIRDLLKFHHPPLWFILLGSLFAIFGFKVWVIYYMQTLLGVLTVWLIYILGRKIYSSSLGLLSAFTLSTLPSFLIITRQGFLEAMICPVVLIGIILVYRLLEDPSKRSNYAAFGFVCGIGMLIKSTFIVSIILLSLIVFIFADRKKADIRRLFKNWLLSFVVMILMILPWYVYAHKPFLNYFMIGMHKGRGLFLFDPGNIFATLTALKNVQLGNLLFFLFIMAIVSFVVKPKAKRVVYLIFFLTSGYFIITLIAFPLIVRHLIYFLPLLIVFICYEVINIPRLKYCLITGVLLFNLVQGYGWFMPKFFQADCMKYIYNDIGINKFINEKYPVYAADINSNNLFSSFAPLPKMEQKAVYEKIKTVLSLSGLRLIKIASPDKYTLEKNTLNGALALYSIMDNFPLVIESQTYKADMVFKERIWIFLRSVEENIDLSKLDTAGKKPIYLGTVSLLPDIICDIFKEE